MDKKKNKEKKNSGILSGIILTVLTIFAVILLFIGGIFAVAFVLAIPTAVVLTLLGFEFAFSNTFLVLAGLLLLAAILN